MGVPSSESSVPVAHILVQALASLLCLFGAAFFAMDWVDTHVMNALSFLALGFLQVYYVIFGSKYFREGRWIRLVLEFEGQTWSWKESLMQLQKTQKAHSLAFLLVILL